MTSISAVGAAWTCPFCPLACDHLRVAAGGATLRLEGGDCARAERALQGFASPPVASSAEIDGRPVPLADAIIAAARVLGASRQPLFAGLGCDVAGARALYPLACATGAICDAAGGDALMKGLRALQDRGQFTTTFAEVRTRADLIVFVGELPSALAPLIEERCGRGAATEVLSADDGDLFTTLSLLNAAVAGRALAAIPAHLQQLATRLRAAKYAVLVGAPALLPAQGALLIEAVHRIVGLLNRDTRAAALWIGGGHGASTANQVFTWLSGLPLRSRAGPAGLEHEPLRFDAASLLADGAVDALLWVSVFDAEATPPSTTLPTVVLGPPAMAAACRRAGSVFIAVSTPGIGSDGHLFRTDGAVLMPLTAARRDNLPSVADIALKLHEALR